MTGMAALVFVLGLRHGFDPDHLAGAERRAAVASRWMSGAVAFLCLALALGSSLKHALPAPAVSIATLLVILVACVLASRSAYREASS